MVESQKLPEYNMDTMPLRRGHILILMIASAGQFFGGALAILVGVIAPLIAMTHHPGLSPWLHGYFRRTVRNIEKGCFGLIHEWFLV